MDSTRFGPTFRMSDAGFLPNFVHELNADFMPLGNNRVEVASCRDPLLVCGNVVRVEVTPCGIA